MGKYMMAMAVVLLLTAIKIPYSLGVQAKEAENSAGRNLIRRNIVGVVVDAHQNPVKEAKVTVLDPDHQEIVARAITNEKGEYVIECLDPREYHLALSALPGQFVGQTVVVSLEKEGQIVQWLAEVGTAAIATTRKGGGTCGCGLTWLSESEDNKRRLASRSNIVGNVTDDQGNPIKDVRVTILDPDTQDIVARRMTDEEGHYAIECLDQDTYNLSLSVLPGQLLGKNAVVDLGREGLDIQWAAHKEHPTIESAKTENGKCACAAFWWDNPAVIGAAVGVVGGGISIGLIVPDDNDDSDRQLPRPPASPSR